MKLPGRVSQATAVRARSVVVVSGEPAARTVSDSGHKRVSPKPLDFGSRIAAMDNLLIRHTQVIWMISGDSASTAARERVQRSRPRTDRIADGGLT